jgi:nodulation protein Z
MSEGKYLVVKGIAGLGNRILSALTGILYARLSGRRLIIDWRDPTFSTDGSNAFQDFFSCTMSYPVDDIPATDSVNPAIWRSNLNRSATSMRKPYKNNREFLNNSIDLTRLDYNEDLLVMWAYHGEVELLRSHFKGKFEEYRHQSKEQILSGILLEHLPLRPLIQAIVSDFKLKYFNGKKTVGVHIRYSDHRASLLAILDKLNTLLRVEPDTLIFLATDNIQIKKMFEENYRSIITTDHWYPIPGARIHDNKACPDKLRSGIESLVDLYLLAECDTLIIDTSSTFSYVAKLLTNAQKSNVFDIARGGKLTPRIRLLSWQLMLRLGGYSLGLKILSKIEKTKMLFIR